jgi:hypothetical protein
MDASCRFCDAACEMMIAGWNLPPDAGRDNKMTTRLAIHSFCFSEEE